MLGHCAELRLVIPRSSVERRALFHGASTSCEDAIYCMSSRTSCVGLHTLSPQAGEQANRCLEGGLCETGTHSTAETMPLLLAPVQTRSALYVSETATSPGLPAELRGKTGKDGDWEEIRQVERGCRTGSIMTGMLSAMVTVWSLMQSEEGHAMNVGFLALATESYQRRQSKFSVDAQLLTLLAYRTRRAYRLSKHLADGSLNACDDQQLMTRQSGCIGPMR